MAETQGEATSRALIRAELRADTLASMVMPECPVEMGASSQLMQRTEELRPAVTSAADFSGEMAEVYASAKASEIARLGYSSKADFVLSRDQDVVLCAERFSFGVSTWYNDNEIEARIAYRDDINADSYLEPGQALSVESPATKATVT